MRKSARGWAETFGDHRLAEHARFTGSGGTLNGYLNSNPRDS